MNAKFLKPGPGNVFAIKNRHGVIELPSIRTSKRIAIRAFIKDYGGTANWHNFKSWGYSVVPMTLRATRAKH